jgi:uncharacterized membrane protein HdeD (DUF308 family)
MEKINIVRSEELSMARMESKNSVAIGVLLVALGMLAIMSPVFTGVSTTIFVGAILLVTGILEIVFAFKQDSFGKGALKFILGGLSIAAAIALFASPAEGMGVLTIILIAYFFASGLLGLVIAFQVKPEEGWGWILFNALLTILFGVLVIANWPVSGVWLLGFYVGIKILLLGILFILTGRTGQEALKLMQDSRIELLEVLTVNGAQMLKEMQVAQVEQAALIAALGKELKTKVSSSDVDPAMKELNKDLGEAREFIQDVKSTTMEAWEKVQDESREDIEKLKQKAELLTKDLKKSLGLDKK